MTDPTFLPGVPAEALLAALRRSPGNEWATGKFDSPESSAALVANAFGWFLDRPADLPPLPGVPMGVPEAVAVEEEVRFPWTGGRHPRLDVVITTPTTLVGVESKRYEPFRPRKAPVFTEPFASREWGPGMARWNTMRRALEDGSQTYRCLDAVQLVKHAYALRNQGIKRARGAVLVYLHAAPKTWANGKPVDPLAVSRHEAEITDFARAVQGSDVVFSAVRWADVLRQWAKTPALSAHSAALTARFGAI
jgi:hypothetical protein